MVDGNSHRWEPEPQSGWERFLYYLDLVAWPITRCTQIRNEVQRKKSFKKLGVLAILGLIFYFAVTATIVLVAGGYTTDYGAPWWWISLAVAIIYYFYGLIAAKEML